MKYLSAALLAAALSLTAPLALAEDAALAVVKTTSERLLKALRANRTALEQNADALYPLVNEIVLPHFDFRAMARWVLGKHWRRATPEQRDRFSDEFRAFLVRTYAKALLAYRDETIRYVSVAPHNRGKTIVYTEIQAAGRPPLPVRYRLRHDDSGGWQVYDIAVDGVSLVTTYRRSFGEQIRRDGIDALIEVLSARNAQRS